MGETTTTTTEYTAMLSQMRETFHSGRTRPLAWRRRQLEGLLKMYKENGQLFAESIYK